MSSKNIDIPKGSRLEKYLQVFPEKLRGTSEDIYSLFRDTFFDCVSFLKRKGVNTLPTIFVDLVNSREEYERKEKKFGAISNSKEEAKIPSKAFVVGNKFRTIIYVDTDSLIDLLKHGYLTFTLNVVLIYLHELLHSAFPEKFEQEIHDLECKLTEEFLGIELPEEIKKRKASDYYNRN